MIGAQSQWIAVKDGELNELYRSTFRKSHGELLLPHGDKIFYRVLPSGRFKWKTERKGLSVQSFDEGEILCRTRKGEWRICNSGVSKKYGVLFISLLVISLIGFTFQSQRRPKRAEPARRVSRTIPAPVTRVPVQPEATPQPTLKAEPALRAPRMTFPVRRSSPRPTRDWLDLALVGRKKLQEGKLEAADDLLLTRLEKNEGNAPLEILRLHSEVEYALCRKTYDQKNWTTAKRYCERAQAHAPHNRADKIVKMMTEKAKASFYEGYVLESFDLRSALIRYQETLSMAPPENPYSVKAAEKIKKIRTVLSVE
jgi:hypothetical protein